MDEMDMIDKFNVVERLMLVKKAKQILNNITM